MKFILCYKDVSATDSKERAISVSSIEVALPYPGDPQKTRIETRDCVYVIDMELKEFVAMLEGL